MLALAVVIVVAQGYMIRSEAFSSYWHYYFKLGGASPDLYGDELPWSWVRKFDERFFVLMTIIAATAITSIVFASRGQRISAIAALATIVSISALDLFPLSALQW